MKATPCIEAGQLTLYALDMLPAGDKSDVEAHVAACTQCTRELESLQPAVALLASAQADVFQPSTTLWSRLAARVALENAARGELSAAEQWYEPAWEDVAPGIQCQLLATDHDRDRVGMLVRLAPGAEYPPHTHAGVEELHLLDGELWIDDKKLYAGDYYRAEAGTADRRVWSETGCTCVLLTSPGDVLR